MYHFKNPTYLKISLLVLVVILQFIWPLPNMIAIRNTCLIGGGFISLFLILFYFKPQHVNHHLPLLTLFSVPIWLYLHYLWVPVDLKLQWYDLSRTWLRVTLGILITYSLGKVFVNKPIWGNWALTLKKAIRELKGPSPNSIAWIGIFILIGMSLLWVVGEVCGREFIEHFFFIISLSASYLGHLENKAIDMYSDLL